MSYNAYKFSRKKGNISAIRFTGTEGVSAANMLFEDTTWENIDVHLYITERIHWQPTSLDVWSLLNLIATTTEQLHPNTEDSVSDLETAFHGLQPVKCWANRISTSNFISMSSSKEVQDFRSALLQNRISNRLLQTRTVEMELHRTGTNLVS